MTLNIRASATRGRWPRKGRGSIGPWRSTLLLLLAPSACDIPLGAPEWTADWAFTAVADTLDAGDLLPSGVRALPDGFAVDSLLLSNDVRIGDICELCTCFSGPIPPVSLTPQDYQIPLPAGLIGAGLRRGRARIVLTNELPFDLLDDGQGHRGNITVELTNTLTNQVVERVEINDPFPPGTSLTLEFDLAGLELNRQLIARVQGSTPGSGCDSISVSPDDGIRADVSIFGAEAEWVQIVLSDAVLDLEPREIEIPRFIADRLRPGDARIVLDTRVANGTGATAEIIVSAAVAREDLFSERAALFTPIPIPMGTATQPAIVERLFVLDLESVAHQRLLYLETASRVVGNRIVRLEGDEFVAYTVTLKAQIPSK